MNPWEGKVTFMDRGLFARGLPPLTSFAVQVSLQAPDCSHLNGWGLRLLKTAPFPSVAYYFFDHVGTQGTAVIKSQQSYFVCAWFYLGPVSPSQEAEVSFGLPLMSCK